MKSLELESKFRDHYNPGPGPSPKHQGGGAYLPKMMLCQLIHEISHSMRQFQQRVTIPQSFGLRRSPENRYRLLGKLYCTV